MGHQGGIVRRHHHGGGFLHSSIPGQSMRAAYQDWRRKSEKAATDYGFHMSVTSWSRQVFDEMETVVKTYGINTFKHFMAYKGALMVNDDEPLSISLCALRPSRRHAAGARGERRRGGADAGGIAGARRHRAGGPCLFAAAGGRGRGHQPRHQQGSPTLRPACRSMWCIPAAANPTRRSRAPAPAAGASMASP